MAKQINQPKLHNISTVSNKGPGDDDIKILDNNEAVAHSKKNRLQQFDF